MIPLCGHRKLVGLIERLAVRPASAYGFFGPEHVGKRRLAEHFARLLAEHPEPLPLEGHPDIALLDASTQGDIDSVRGFLERMHRTSARGGYRVFIIDHAESLNTAGFNALLKDVEEPRPRTVFLFVSAQPDALPATLRSRLVPLSVRTVPLEDLQPWAQAHVPSAATNLEELFGRPGLALRREEDLDGWNRLMKHATNIITAYHRPEPGSLIAALDEWQKTLDASEHAEQEWRILLLMMSQQLVRTWSADQEAFATALASAWRSVGGSLSPRLSFEWKRLQSLVDPMEYPEILEPWAA